MKKFLTIATLIVSVTVMATTATAFAQDQRYPFTQDVRKFINGKFQAPVVKGPDYLRAVPSKLKKHKS